MKNNFINWLENLFTQEECFWKNWQTLNFAEFLKKYTLHDSILVKMYTEFDNSVTLILKWDTYWTNGKIPYVSSEIKKWPILLIYFSEVFKIQFRDFKNDFSENGISSCETFYLKDKDLFQTILTNHSDEKFFITHANKTKLLCLSYEKKVINIPDVSSTP